MQAAPSSGISSSSDPAQQQQQQQLSIADCPLLPEGCQLPLLDRTGAPLTLQQLQGPDWWLLLPQPLQDSWRREAGGGSWLFAPTAADLQGPTQEQAAAAAVGDAAATAAGGGRGSSRQRKQEGQAVLGVVSQCALARVLFWARWLLGEPIIVRETQVGGCSVQ